MNRAGVAMGAGFDCRERATPMIGPPFIYAIDHVQLAMPPGQGDSARAFYGGLLGLAEVPRPESLAGRRAVWFEGCGVKLHLGVEPDFRPARKAHPALVVYGLDALVARLEDAAVEIVRDEPLPGFDRVHVNDPFGNRLELLEPAGAAVLPEFRISDRHRLRLPAISDADELFRLVDQNRLHLRQWLPWVDRTSCPADTRRVIESGLRQFATHQGFHAVICVDGAIAGVIGFHAIDWLNRCTSIGYWLSESHQGRGLMTASCRAVIEHAFGAWNVNRIVIRCATGNRRSQAVVERLGFTREGIQREAEWLYDHYVDLACYSLLRADWDSRAEVG